MADLRVRWFLSSACRPNSPSFLSDQLALAQRFRTWQKKQIHRSVTSISRELMLLRYAELDTEVIWQISDMREGNN